MSIESYKVGVPHPNYVLLVLCPVFKLCWRQIFWWLDPKPCHQEIKQRVNIREGFVSQQERLVK
jgi:hypothetical protein